MNHRISVGAEGPCSIPQAQARCMTMRYSFRVELHTSGDCDTLPAPVTSTITQREHSIMIRTNMTVFAAICALAPLAPAHAGDPEAGKRKAIVCSACHGPDGNSINPLWPKLAGQHAAYLTKQMKAFRSGERKDPGHGADGDAVERCRHRRHLRLLRHSEAEVTTSEAAPRTDKACTASPSWREPAGRPLPSQPRTFTQETPFGNLAQL